MTKNISSVRVPKFAMLAALLFCMFEIDAHAQGIPFVDLPKPYEKSGPIVSVPAQVIGGGVGMVVGALFIPPAIVASILPGWSLFDAVTVPPKAGWNIGEQTLGRVVGFPIWLVKKIVWDIPVAIISA